MRTCAITQDLLLSSKVQKSLDMSGSAQPDSGLPSVMPAFALLCGRRGAADSTEWSRTWPALRLPAPRWRSKTRGTGIDRETATDASGNYEFLAVPVDSGYTLKVIATGFETSVQSGFRLEVNQRYLVDFKLQVGAVVQTVSVTGSAVEVESSSTTVGDVIEDRKIIALPLNGRSYLDLLGLQPGVAPVSNPSPFQPTIVASGDLTTGLLSVNGQRENANAFMVNGSIVEDNGSNGAGAIPVLDSIQEFRLLTSTFDPEYGNFSGAVINVITKSGTNQFHGSVFEFLRNTDLDAKTYFNSTRGTLIRNQFGGSAGGPVIKNHLFFFGDYQGTRQIEGLATGNLNVPSAAQKSGDFRGRSQRCSPTCSKTAIPSPPFAGIISRVTLPRRSVGG